MISLFLALIIIVSVQTASAQSQSTFKRTTATVLFASIGGGVLGLSTLSFYGKPQEHTDNITTGVLLGFLAGVTYVMYDNYTQRLAVNENPMKEWIIASSPQKKRSQQLGWPLFSFEYNF